MNRGRAIAGALLVVAAIALQQSATRVWGLGVAADGTTFALTPVGLSMAPLGATRTTDCRWWPRYGDRALCATRPGAEATHARVRLGYPALLVALWTAVAAFFLMVLRIPRAALVRVALCLAVSALTVAGATFVAGAKRGLAALADIPLRLTGPGLWLAAVAGLAALAAGLLEWRVGRVPSADPPPERRSA